jgi:transposase
MEKRLRALIVARPSAYYRVFAKELQIPLQTLIDWMIKRLGFPRRGRRTKLTPEMEKRLRTLVAERPLASRLQLARALQISAQTVMRWINQLGLPHRAGRCGYNFKGVRK